MSAAGKLNNGAGAIRRGILLAAAALYAPACARPGSEAADVLSTVRAFDDAWARKDTAAAGRFLASEYRYFSSTGQVWPRARLMGLLASPGYVLERAERLELEPRLYGRTAVVGSRWRGAGRYDGKAFLDDQRCGLVLTRRASRWEMVAEQCTEIEPT